MKNQLQTKIQKLTLEKAKKGSLMKIEDLDKYLKKKETINVAAYQTLINTHKQLLDFKRLSIKSLQI